MLMRQGNSWAVGIEVDLEFGNSPRFPRPTSYPFAGPRQTPGHRPKLRTFSAGVTLVSPSAPLAEVSPPLARQRARRERARGYARWARHTFQK